MSTQFFKSLNQASFATSPPLILGGEGPYTYETFPPVLQTSSDNSDCQIVEYTIPESGWYFIYGAGAQGCAGGFLSTTPYEYYGGYGAALGIRVWCNEGDELRILVGRRGRIVGQSHTTTVTDSVAGAGGGGTSVWRVVDSITNAAYQFTKAGTLYAGEIWECLLFAAGGGGTCDLVYSGQSSNRGNGTSANITTFYGPKAATICSFSTIETTTSTYNTSSASYSASTSGNNRGPAQVMSYDGMGTYYTRNSATSYGGFGCGSGSDDSKGAPGAWYTSGTNYYSFCYEPPLFASNSSTPDGFCYIMRG